MVRRDVALDEFSRFLQSQGRIIAGEIPVGQTAYQYACVAVVHKIVQAKDGRWIYVPKFEIYFTRFTPETLPRSCGKKRSYRFKFDVEVMSGAFMVGNWENFPDFRDKVRSFIERFGQTDIADSENYFEGVFQSTPA